MNLNFNYRQTQALADDAAFKQFDRARVAGFLRFYNGSGWLGQYSSGERLLAVWLTQMLSGVELPQTLAALAGLVTLPLSASAFERSTAGLGVPAESLAMLTNEIARQALTGVDKLPTTTR